jgi:hypothetical protein
MIEATMSEKKGSVEITASPDAVMEAAQKETVTVPSGGPTDSGRSAIRQTGSDLQHALTSTKRGGTRTWKESLSFVVVCYDPTISQSLTESI